MVLLISISLKPAAAKPQIARGFGTQLTARLVVLRRFTTAKCSRRVRNANAHA
jgi:hypothetical protein